MTDKVLLSINDNWADEMDIQGAIIITEEAYQNFDKQLKEHFHHNDTLEYYIGSNEEMTHTSYEDVIASLTVTPVTKKEIEILSKFFPSISSQFGYGTTNLYFSLTD